MSLFGAGWTLGAIKYLAEAAADSVTLFETTGWRGVMEVETGSPLPDQFASQPGMVFPMYHVLADVAGLDGAEVLPCESSRPLEVHGLALRHAGTNRLLLANLMAEAASATICGVSGTIRMRVLDESSFETSSQQPDEFRAAPGQTIEAVDGRLVITLPPLAYARLDW
jgi:hypothetical protein